MLMHNRKQHFSIILLWYLQFRANPSNVAFDGIINRFQSWFEIFYGSSADHSKSNLAINDASIWIITTNKSYQLSYPVVFSILFQNYDWWWEPLCQVYHFITKSSNWQERSALQFAFSKNLEMQEAAGAGYTTCALDCIGHHNYLTRAIWRILRQTGRNWSRKNLIYKLLVR